MRKVVFLISLFVSVIVSAQKQYAVESIPRPNQYDATNFVSNPDGILSRQTVSQINAVINSLENDTKAEVAVVAVNSIGTQDISNFSVKLFEKWGIGKAGADNGLLIVFVLDQRTIKFETGYGLEGVLTDALGRRIQEEAMFPYFRKGDYNAGMLAGVQRVASVIREEPVAVPAEELIQWGVVLPIALALYIIIVLLSFLWVNSIVSKVKNDKRYPTNIARYKAIKSQKSGMVSVISFILPLITLFIVVFFIRAEYIILVIPMPFLAIPANLYAKYRMRKIRRQPIPCDVCGGTMHILSEKDEDKYLSVSQQFEEQLSAVDYDVFLCDKCDNTLVFTLDKPSAYSICPKCGTKAFIKTGSKVIVAPTYVSTGVQQTIYKCKFCGYEEHKNTKLPRLRRSNAGAVAGGMAAGSVLRGGGGFSGGGSFGGGRSGGGGAVGRW
ncbi:TPM domain-containing protein [Paludibacter sp. 221]|uniref:TPM domain-containing protein n=1 Tax=Paludibacter sp. 221 TaxID=2302939 RepID=UPI0013D091C0|nr:TPM domain-containing protein [Paludibacter sp. 221]NDV47697.1 TPM domain-containing protein [Paludibacter sp. 221]